MAGKPRREPRRRSQDKDKAYGARLQRGGGQLDIVTLLHRVRVANTLQIARMMNAPETTTRYRLNKVVRPRLPVR